MAGVFEWCEWHPGWTKLIIGAILITLIAVGIAVEPIGAFLGLALILSLVGLAFYAVVSIIYEAIFE